jgi:hypothetical protein
MPLKFLWNGLYARHPTKRAFAMSRIQAHVSRFNLERHNVAIANVRYVCIESALSLMILILSCRPTGWHGESGNAKSGGHITVDFRSRSSHITTHHVYKKDDAYSKMERRGR